MTAPETQHDDDNERGTPTKTEDLYDADPVCDHRTVSAPAAVFAV